VKEPEIMLQNAIAFHMESGKMPDLTSPIKEAWKNISP
jgi:hypothetical protein